MRKKSNIMYCPGFKGKFKHVQYHPTVAWNMKGWRGGFTKDSGHPEHPTHWFDISKI